jgi:ArsR family transcriptional regulator
MIHPMNATEMDTAQVARWFHALSDETRIGIVRRLAGGERCVCDLQGDLEAAQSRLSFHLKVLKEAGLVRDRKVGRWSYYALNPALLDAMAQFLAAARPPEESWAQDAGGCCR